MAAQCNSSSTPQTLKFSTTAHKSKNPNSISKVRVIVRVRPFLPQEITAKDNNPTPCVSVLEQKCESTDEVAVYLKDRETSRSECYRLDSFFGQEDNSVGQIFYREVSPLISELFHGRNATVFAYGATGSGKTFTMQGTEDLPGLMPLAMSTILSLCQSTGSKVEMSYYEVYLDRCYDLLEPKAKEISIWDDKEGQVHLSGLSRVLIKSMQEFYEIFSCGVQKRKVAHTSLNDVSSRSHGVLVITVSAPPSDDCGAVITGKLNLIDLAGNEDNRRTCNEGIRLQESAKINQSLFALSNVIYALNNNKLRVPYRDSKLTRILQDSLGGTSHALMVACLNPGEYMESVYTVNLASRSRNISNFVSSAHKQETPKVKVDMEAKLRAWLESKGKIKSGQKIGLLSSPFVLKTPGSVHSVKKIGIHNGSVKAKVNTNRNACDAKERNMYVPSRNLFNINYAVESCSQIESLHLGSKDDKEEIKDGSDPHIVETDTHLTGGVLNQEQSSADIFASSPTSQEKYKRSQVLCPVNTNIYHKPAEEFSFKNQTDALLLEPRTPPYLTSASQEKNKRSPSKKVLSPVNTNIYHKPTEEFSFKDQTDALLLEPRTPPYLTSASNRFHKRETTPLDKFNARSSNLKNYLAQEYIDFLNTASKEELLKLKGIGEKMAEYILDLRQSSPLQSLSDLENIGLSTKQIHNLFSRAISGILDKDVEDTTMPSCLEASEVK